MGELCDWWEDGGVGEKERARGVRPVRGGFFFFFFFFELNLFNVEQILVYIDGAGTRRHYTKVKGGNKGHIKGDKYVRVGGRSTGGEAYNRD